MFVEHPIFISPKTPDQAIWRYMDFTKLVDILSTGSLYFTRSDLFTDIFEGSIPKKTVELRDSVEWENLMKIPGYVVTNWSKNFYRNRKEIAINCWHMNEHESEAMWKLYLQSNEGIAIQSTYGRLIKCFDDSVPALHIGQVNYIDYETDHFNITNNFNPFLHKRKSFEHERELRAIIWNQELPNQNIVDLSTGGFKVQCNLHSLINKIYLSPESPLWFSKLVEDIVIKYGYKFPVTTSTLIAKPLY